jgi:hypothetical protein
MTQSGTTAAPKASSEFKHLVADGDLEQANAESGEAKPVVTRGIVSLR